MHLASIVTAAAVTCGAAAQSCLRPVPPAGGFATQVELIVPVTYADGYQTFGSMIVPVDPPPACGWPLVVFVHPLGQNRGFELGHQLDVAAQGYAVWSYDVRGQGQAIAANPGHSQAGTTLWGVVERYDLAEQIRFVAANPMWAGIVDATRLAVVGSSQGGGHGWQAAAWSGQTISSDVRPPIPFPDVACVVATDLVPDSSDDWTHGGTLFSSWLIEAIAGSYSGVVLDPTLSQNVREAFLAQDPADLLSTLVAEGRATAAPLASSTVPVLHGFAYFDQVGNPLSGVTVAESRTAPHRLLLGTIGHGVPANIAERAHRDATTLRWLHRYLWGVPNEVDSEEPFVLAELPLAASQRDDVTHLWSRSHAAAVTTPSTATRLYLHDDSVLRDTSPTGPATAASIVQAIDPAATAFTPFDYLDQPSAREVANVLAACPLSELVYSYTTTADSRLIRSATAHLELVPGHVRWLLAALLTVEPPSPGAEEVMIASTAVAGTASVPGTAESHELRFPPIAVQIPAGSTVRLRLRNLWLRELPMVQRLEVAPLFTDFQVDVLHDAAPAGSWLDLPLEAEAPRLVADRQWLDLVAPEVVGGTIRGGLARAGYPYFAAVGLSGHRPSTPFLNDVVPVEGDWLVLASAAGSAPFYQQFLGFLDGAGEATIALDYSSLAPLPAVLNGLQLTMVGFVWDGSWAPTGAASNPFDVLMR